MRLWRPVCLTRDRTGQDGSPSTPAAAHWTLPFNFLNNPAMKPCLPDSVILLARYLPATLVMNTLNPETNVMRTLLVDAPAGAVWKALTDPKLARLYMGSMPCCDLRPGKPMQWFVREENGDQTLVAKGLVLAVQPGRRLRYSFYSMASKLPDEPASHTTVDLHLVPEEDGRTRVEFWQGDFAGLPDAERRAREAGRNWVEHLVGLKRVAEEVWESKAA